MSCYGNSGGDIMKNLFTGLLLLLVTTLTGCGWSAPIAAINPLNVFSTGTYPLLIIGELETNLSSVFIDKTKARIENVSINPFEVLPENSLVFVMPAIINKKDSKNYDTYYTGLLQRYLAMNNFAKVTTDLDKADFVLMMDISESPEKFTGTNYSVVSVSIVEKDERPVFFSSITVKSSSDRNFYHRPTKAARPVKELTLLGLEETLKVGLPQAFGLER